MSAVTQLGRGRSPAPAPVPSSLHHSRPPLPPPSSTSPHPPSPQFLLRHVPEEQCPPAIPPPAVPLLPFFFIKLLKQQSVEGRTVAGAQLADPAVLLNDNTAGASSPPSLLLHSIGGRPPASVSRCGSSTSSEAIGKQRPKMNYPVSSPSLTNK